MWLRLVERDVGEERQNSNHVFTQQTCAVMNIYKSDTHEKRESKFETSPLKFLSSSLALVRPEFEFETLIFTA